jgi:hypothetical protein
MMKYIMEIPGSEYELMQKILGDRELQDDVKHCASYYGIHNPRAWTLFEGLCKRFDINPE